MSDVGMGGRQPLTHSHRAEGSARASDCARIMPHLTPTHHTEEQWTDPPNSRQAPALTQKRPPKVRPQVLQMKRQGPEEEGR